MKIEMTPIGVFYTREKKIPRHWSVSDVIGMIEIDKIYKNGLKDISKGQKIIVLFNFHKSRPFDPKYIIQTPPHKERPMGVFSICSPYRPNPIGLSVLTVLNIEANIISVNHVDMIDGTPILDIKPYIEGKTDCPSYPQASGEI